jgi:DNA-directed RNA polymerase subunit L
MEIEVLKEEKHELQIQFSEIDHGFLNLIKEAIWQQSGVELASFRLEHPEVGKPFFILKTKGKEAKKVWNSAVEAINEQLEKLGKEAKKLK